MRIDPGASGSAGAWVAGDVAAGAVGARSLTTGTSGVSAAARPCSLASAASGSTSASITRRLVFVRSWLRSSRTVSMFASTSSVPPAMKPATSTRWKADTSSFGWIGVSIGIS